LQGALRPLPSAQLQSFKSASRDKAVAGAGVGPFLGGKGGICLVGAEGFEPPTLCSQIRFITYFQGVSGSDWRCKSRRDIGGNTSCGVNVGTYLTSVSLPVSARFRRLVA
jgi:hypothetical protein